MTSTRNSEREGGGGGGGEWGSVKNRQNLTLRGGGGVPYKVDINHDSLKG